MIKLKHFMDAVEEDDGIRIWTEPLGLTRDLRDWCKVDHVLPHLGPPRDVWEWFEEHAEGYEYFRARYHEALARSQYQPALQQLVRAGRRENFTLLYEGDDPQHNTATALYEFITALEPYCPPET